MAIYAYRLRGSEVSNTIEGIIFYAATNIDYSTDQPTLNKHVSSLLDRWVDGVLDNTNLAMLEDTTVSFNDSTKHTAEHTALGVVNPPRNLFQNALGWLVPSLATADAATYSQTTTLITVTSTAHGVPISAHDGKSVYLKVATGTLVTGWFTNFAYVDANTFTCVSTTSVLEPITGTLSTNTTETTLPLVVEVPAASIGANGSLSCTALWTMTGSTNNKTQKIKLDTTALLTKVQATANVISDFGTVSAFNKNSVAAQVIFGGTGYIGTSTVACISGTVNTAVAKNITVTTTLAAANELVALEMLAVNVQPSA